MADIKFTNNATTTLALSLAEGATTLVVKANDGDKFPALTGSEYFIGTLVRGDGASEIVKVTARTADSLTIERAQEGTTALAFSADDIFELRLTAGSLETVINIPDADEATVGLTQFATDTEVTTGTEAAKAISPLRFRGYMDDISVGTPTLVLPASATEKTTVNGTYTLPAGSSADWSVPSAITDFTDNNDGTFSFTAPDVTADTDYTLYLAAVQVGYLTSPAASDTISILNVPVQDGPTIAIANTSAGWPAATIDGTNIVAPATSVGTNNTAQFVTGIMEVTQTSGELPVLAGTTATSLVTSGTVAENDELATDQGDVTAGTVTDTGGTSTIQETNSGVVAQGGTKYQGFLATGETLVDFSFWFASGGTTGSKTLKLWTDNGSNTGLGVELTTTSITVPSSGKATGTFNYSGLTIGDRYWVGFDDQTTWIDYTNSTQSYADGIWLQDSTALPSYNWTFEATMSTPEYAVDITSGGFASAPTKVYKKEVLDLKLGAGTTDEYLGPELNLVFETGAETQVDDVRANSGGTTTGTSLYVSQYLSVPNDRAITELALGTNTSASGTVELVIVKSLGGTNVETVATLTTSVASVDGIQRFALDTPFIGDGSSTYWLGFTNGTLTGGILYTSAASGLRSDTDTTFGSVGTQLALDSASTFEMIMGYTYAAAGSSTASDLVFVSSESIKDKIYIADGLHNNIEIDAVEHEISAVSEVETPGTTELSNASGSVAGSTTMSTTRTYHGVQFTATHTEVAGASIYSDASPSGSPTARVSIYTDSGADAPSTLVGSWSSSAAVATGENVYTFTTSGLTVGNSYWLMIEYTAGSGYYNAEYVTGSPADYTLSKYGNTTSLAEGTLTTTQQWRSKIQFTDSTYETTATLTTPLGSAPAGTETVVVPERCVLDDAGVTYAVSTSCVVTSTKVTPTEDPQLKRFAMRVAGPTDLEFTSAKIYTEELP